MHTPLPEWVIWSDVAIRLGWAAIAIAIWFVMSRRGHDGVIWAIVGVVLGPVAVPAAIVSARRSASRPPIVVEEGPDAAAEVLVVIDPDAPATWACEARAVNELGTTAELVVVVSRDTLDVAAREATVQRARCALSAVAVAVAGPPPRQVILEGRPAEAIMRHRQTLGGPMVITPSNRLGERLRESLPGVHSVPPMDVSSRAGEHARTPT